jgi:predicted DNA-binding transcriptional regulator AlpA
MEKLQVAEETDLLTVKQIAAKLRLCPDSVRNHVRAGNLPAPLRLGTRTHRWRAADISACIAALPQRAA